MSCTACKTSTRAPLPAGVPTGQFGPRLQAIVAVCSGDYRLSKREIELLVEDVFVARIEEGTSCSSGLVAGRCREILTLEPALWTFVSIEGVDPTNNFAEQILRQGVLWRKGSFGTDSPKGSRFVERILTVVTTLRLQRRNVLDYMTAACEAALHGTAPPSLLPA